ncbi:hypothetical protein CH063_02799, partial [Colletotrichum higginsianum]
NSSIKVPSCLVRYRFLFDLRRLLRTASTVVWLGRRPVFSHPCFSLSYLYNSGGLLRCCAWRHSPTGIYPMTITSQKRDLAFADRERRPKVNKKP